MSSEAWKIANRDRTKAQAAKRYRANRDHYREMHKRWRDSHPEATRRYGRRRQQAFRDRLAAIKVEHGCIDCGYRAHAAALDFDHRDPASKSFDLTKSYRNWASIEREIAKCDVRCANCHRVRTVEEGHYSAQRREVIVIEDPQLTLFEDAS